MAFYASETVIGLELSADSVQVSELSKQNKAYVVTNVAQLTLPPRLIVEGMITDPETLGDLLKDLFQEHAFSSKNIVVGVNNSKILKRSGVFPILPIPDLRAQLELSVASHPFFYQKEFYVGFQRFRSPVYEAQEDPEIETVVYAALGVDSIESIKDLALELEMNLIGINILSLSVLRAIQWKAQPFKNEPVVFLYTEKTYSEMIIVYKEKILEVVTFRNSVADILNDEFGLESFTIRLKQSLARYANYYPQCPAPTVIYEFSRTPQAKELHDALNNALNMDIRHATLPDTISCQQEELFSGEDKQLQFQRYVPSIGVALSYFEPYNESLSIAGERRQVEPIFEKRALILYGGIFMALMAGLLGTSSFINNKANTMAAEVLRMKDTIKTIQEEMAVGRETKIASIKESMSFFGSAVKKGRSIHAFFYDISENLPADISFSSIILNDRKTQYSQVTVKGQAYFQDSIYTLYEELKQKYSKVKLGDISTTYNEDGIGSSKFTLSFNWWK